MGNNLLKSIYAVSEVLGTLFITSIIVTGISVISLSAQPIILNSQEEANIQAIEQGFMLLDSRISKSGLGWSPEQITSIKTENGVFSIEDNGYIVINRSDTPNDEINVSLSSLVYELNGREIAWEGGGVWSKYPDGGSVMLSPPEFHYNGETLTLPIINITGDSSSGSTDKTSIICRYNGDSMMLYPSIIGENRKNPVSGETANIAIRSEYYDAWARYIDELTYCEAIAYASNKTAHITLLILPQLGEKLNFPPPIKFIGINNSDPYPLDYFYFNMSDVTSNFEMDLRAPNPNSDIPSSTPSLHIQLKKEGGGGTSGVRIKVYYSDNNNVEEFWTDTLLAINADDTADIDLLNSSLGTTYKSNDDSWTWDDPIDSPYDKVYDKNINKTGPPLAYVIQHYIRTMAEEIGAFNLNYGENGPDKHTGFDESGSTYGLNYEGTDVLTYLHITDNEVEVSFGF
ncbi:MAG: hypothetical protein SVM80_07605 [Halobacteriota archaeon]|nr:hypothetical protein [Halobacteriota archaeon]